MLVTSKKRERRTLCCDIDDFSFQVKKTEITQR